LVVGGRAKAALAIAVAHADLAAPFDAAQPGRAVGVVGAAVTGRDVLAALPDAGHLSAAVIAVGAGLEGLLAAGGLGQRVVAGPAAAGALTAVVHVVGAGVSEALAGGGVGARAAMTGAAIARAALVVAAAG
jgi:hypothetical protein